MANVVLKDKNGSATTYSDINQIDAQGENGVYRFSMLSTIYTYFAVLENNQYRITGSIPALGRVRGKDGVILLVYNGVIDDYGVSGNDQLFYIITTKKLTVGQSYTSDYIRGT